MDDSRHQHNDRTNQFRTGGPAEYEYLSVGESDGRGRISSNVYFDPGDLDAAYAELDRRFAAGEGAPHARILATLAELARAWSARDGEALERVADESFTLTSHRLVRSGETLERAGLIASCHVLREMGVEDSHRVDHLRVTPRGALRMGMWPRHSGRRPVRITNRPRQRNDGERVLSQDMYDAEHVGIDVEFHGIVPFSFIDFSEDLDIERF